MDELALAFVCNPLRGAHEGWRGRLAERVPAGMVGEDWGGGVLSRLVVEDAGFPSQEGLENGVLRGLLEDWVRVEEICVWLGLALARKGLIREMQGEYLREVREEVGERAYAFVRGGGEEVGSGEEEWGGRGWGMEAGVQVLMQLLAPLEKAVAARLALCWAPGVWEKAMKKGMWKEDVEMEAFMRVAALVRAEAGA